MTEQELLTSTSLPQKHKLTIGQGREAYKRHKAGESISKLADEYQVEWHTLDRAIKRYKESKLPSYLRNIYYGGTTDKKYAEYAKKKNNKIIEKWCK